MTDDYAIGADEIVIDAPNPDFDLDTDDAANQTNNETNNDTVGKENAGQPAGEPDAAKADAPVEPITLADDAKVKVGDQEYTGSQIQELITAAGDRAELQNWREQQTAAVAMTEFVAAMPQEYQDRLFAFAGELDAEMRGGKPAATAAPSGFKVPDGAKVVMPAWDDMSEEMRAVVAQFSPVVTELNLLKTQLTDHGLKLDAMGKVIPDVENYVRGSREERAQSAAIAKIQGDLGIAVTPAEIQAAVKATGVQDPEAAWLKANAKKVSEAGATAASGRAAAKPIDSPTGQGRSFSPLGLSADQIAANLNAGMSMQK